MSGTFPVSPAAAYSTDALTDTEKADIRAFCGYETYGLGPDGRQSWRFFQVNGTLEFRMANLQPAELQNVRYFLDQCYTLRTAQMQTSDNLDTDQAAVWYHNKNEMADRQKLLAQWVRYLCAAITIPPGPNFVGNIGLRLVV